nr:hypothetical protein [uncultured Friedmanniella sp.]
MAQPQKAPRQAKDSYAQRSKALTSSVQRLRGWVGTDPSRLPELGDALVELTGHRLRGHDFAAAVEDAQDSVRQAVQLLTANGPVGAYTDAVDAARYITAVVQLAAVQAGLGLAEPAARTVASLDDLHEQFLALRLELPLTAEVVVRALACTAAGALASGDVTTANTTADDAAAHLVAAGLDQDPDLAYLAIDVDRLLADARWAANRPDDSLAYLHRARDRWVEVVDGRLDAPAGRSPALVERLAAPAFVLHRDLADRLVATGEIDLGLVTRRALVDLLRRLAGRFGATTERQLGLALTDLAADLLAVGRTEEADAVSDESLAVLGATAEPGWPDVVRARILLGTGRATQAFEVLRSHAVPPGPQPVTGLVHLALAEAHRAVGDAEAAAAAEQAADEVVAQLSLDGRDRLLDRARGVISRGRAPLTWPSPGTTVWDRLVPGAPSGPASSGAAAVEDPAAWLAAERTEAHRREEEREAQARAEAERLEAEQRAAAQRAAQEQEQARVRAEEQHRAAEAQRAADEELERQERKRRREERLESYRLEAERREAERIAAELAETQAQAESPREPAAQSHAPEPADELAVATQAWQQARADGDRRATRAAAERLVEQLRPHASQDPSRHGPLLHQVLSELAGRRVRGGDLLGARSASREAKELARALGR